MSKIKGVVAIFSAGKNLMTTLMWQQRFHGFEMENFYIPRNANVFKKKSKIKINENLINFQVTGHTKKFSVPLNKQYIPVCSGSTMVNIGIYNTILYRPKNGMELVYLQPNYSELILLFTGIWTIKCVVAIFLFYGTTFRITPLKHNIILPLSTCSVYIYFFRTVFAFLPHFPPSLNHTACSCAY